ncbi:MAG: chorismate-binding protein, partial [Solirubrobacteraceae bacterium]
MISADADHVPVAETWIEDTETPVSAFLKLRGAASGEPAFLLESADQGRVGRFSFIGYRPRKVLRWSPGDPADPYALVQQEIDAVHTQQPLGVELPFGGGAVGMFAYDLVRTVEALGQPNPDEIGLPDLALMLTDTLVAFDHLKRTITVVAHPSDDADTARVKVDAIRQILAGPLPRPALTPEVAYRTAPEFVSNMTREHFEATVARIVDYIHAGDAFQVVPSQRWSARTPVGGFSIYRGLRAVNPSPYMYYLDFGDFEIAGASPEPLVTVSGRR